MKKLFYAVSLLLTLSVLLMIGSQAVLAAGADDVSVVAETLYGDPTAAIGASTSMRATMDNHLYWDIFHTVGGDTDIDFFYTEERGHSTGESGYFQLSSFSGVGMTSSGSIDFEEEEGMHMFKPAAALAAEMGKNEKCSKVYRLADFYDYYTIHSDIRLPSESNNVRWHLDSEEEQAFLNDYFRFPVHPDHTVTVTVETNAMGDACDVNMQTVGETDFQLGTYSTYTDHGFYFTFSIYNGLTPLDTSHIKDGYGIYITPLAPNSAGVLRTPEGRDPIELAIPLSTDIDVSGIDVHPDQTELYLLYGKDGMQYLDVYALPSMEKRQTIELPQHHMEGGTVHMTDLMTDETGVLLNGGSCMTFLAPDASGALAVQTIGDYLTALNEYGSFYTWNGLDYSWNGERLAIVYPIDFYENCDYYLLIFDAAGLAYTGRIGLDLNDRDNGREHDRYHYQYDYRIHFDSLNPYDDENYLSVSW